MGITPAKQIAFRAATPSDLATLLELMPGYYAADGLTFDAARARAAMTQLLNEPHWGRVWLIEVRGVAAGYVALCLGFSLEVGGNDAFIDELYVRPEYRGLGLGRQALDVALQEAQRLGVKTLHLLVNDENERAQNLYASLGFKRRERFFLMSRVISD